MGMITQFVVMIVLMLLDLYTVLLFLRLFTTSRDRYDSVLGMVFHATDPIVTPLTDTVGTPYASFVPLLLICGFVVLKGLVTQSPLAALSMVLRIYDFYMLLLFVRVFTTRGDRHDPILNLIFRLTDPLITRLTGTLDMRYVSLIPWGLLGLFVLVKGLVFSSMAFALYSFIDMLLQLYGVTILILATYHELYIYPIASLGQRLVRPVQNIFAQVSRQPVMLTILSVVFCVLAHVLLTLLLQGVVDTGLLRNLTPKGALIRSLGLLVNLAQFFIAVIIILVVLSWVSADPDNPVVQLLDLISAPIMTPIRRVIPPLIGALDLSPMLAIFLLVIVNDMGHQILGLL